MCAGDARRRRPATRFEKHSMRGRRSRANRAPHSRGNDRKPERAKNRSRRPSRHSLCMRCATFTHICTHTHTGCQHVMPMRGAPAPLTPNMGSASGNSRHRYAKHGADDIVVAHYRLGPCHVGGGPECRRRLMPRSGSIAWSRALRMKTRSKWFLGKQRRSSSTGQCEGTRGGSSDKWSYNCR